MWSTSLCILSCLFVGENVKKKYVNEKKTPLCTNKLGCERKLAVYLVAHICCISETGLCHMLLYKHNKSPAVNLIPQSVVVLLSFHQ